MSELELRSHDEWCELIEEQESSGETITAFCELRSLAQHSFYYHKRRRREQVGGFRELDVSGSSGVKVVIPRTFTNLLNRRTRKSGGVGAGS